MISRTLLVIRRVTRKLWFRVVLISLSSLIALAVAPLIAPFIPHGLADRFGREAVLPVLTILASGMLAVTTFSLNVMVSAYRTASSMATPRVYRLLLEDTLTHSVLATFTGGFVYSLSAIILFRAGLYSPESIIVLFAVTVLVVVLIVVAILRWIDHLSGLGSMDHTLRMIESRSRASLRARAETPCLGGTRAGGGRPEGADAVPARESGFVRFIDMPRLDTLAREAGAKVTFHRVPGDYVLRGRAVAWATGGDEDFLEAAAGLIDIGDVRSFDQDPGFGLTLLAETAERALSPGVNDPGTAIEVMGRLERLLWETLPDDTGEGGSREEPQYKNVALPPVTAQQLLENAFPPIARAGSADPAVMGWLGKALKALENHPNAAMAGAARDMRLAITSIQS
ncbi:DUF2254 domain-containing protein [Roseobacteraceae bacterium NS-SX3]